MIKPIQIHFKQQYLKMSFYRSDTINYFKFILPRESAWEIMNTLGQYNLIHIIPSKSPILQRPFHTQVKRCEESLTKIKNLQKILQDKNILQAQPAYTKAKCKKIFGEWEKEYEKNQKHSISLLEEIDRDVEGCSNYHFDLSKRIQILNRKIITLRQNLAILRAVEQKFGKKFFQGNFQFTEFSQPSSINYKIGVVEIEDQQRLVRTFFRVTRGNCVSLSFPFVDIFQNVLQEEKSKLVFILLFPGKGESILDRKLDKIMESYSGNSFDLPKKQSHFDKVVKNLQSAYQQAENLLTMVEFQFNGFLQKLVQPFSETSQLKRIQNLKLYLLKEKQIYLQLNQMQLYNNFIQGQIYVRQSDVEELQKILMYVEKQHKLPAGQLVPLPSSTLPTFFVKNNFTSSAQEIVETYGVPSYKEANPSFFTIITFPFLFGVMFGDMAHGGLLLAFGLYLVFKKNQITNFALKLLIPHRYLICLMGFFAFYCGIIYNDFMSISLNMFGSCYDPSGLNPEQKIPRIDGCVYGFGVDPVWSIASDSLNYLNSLKMKISVIIAVVHMTLGIFVKASNSLFHKKYLDFFLEFIPQLIFMLALFGYMDFLIIYKWLQYWPDIDTAPSIITTMINFPLKLGKTEDCCGGEPMWGTFGNTSQDTIQLVLLILALLSVPIMLLPKPLYLIFCAKKSEQIQLDQLNQTQLLQIPKHEKSIISSNSSQNEEEEPSEIFVHQLIETIQYVLGCISNTASYLRLWALSLAHSQLSEVFLEKTVQPGISRGYLGIPLMIIGFPMLAGTTFAVLLCMDSMQCFLHTLRLHWVEFQNKFYKGNGFAFAPYSFEMKIKQESKQQ